MNSRPGMVLQVWGWARDQKNASPLEDEQITKRYTQPQITEN